MNHLLDLITEANKAVRPYVRITPLDFSPLLSKQTGCKVYLKCEHLQQTGSFKFRGAINKLRSLDPALKSNGVITASTGNHGQAMALAGQLMGVPVTVYAPETAAAIKLDAIRNYGGQVELTQGDALAAELTAGDRAKQQGKPFVSPYNDYDVIAGQGTIGVELFEQQPDLDAVFVSVGGGGLISGIASWLKQHALRTQVIGCWPANATAMYSCIQAGQIIDVQEQKTLSDGTAGGVEPNAVTFPLCQRLIDRHVLVSEDEIRQAMRLIAQTDRWMIEGAAGVALASALRLAPALQGKKIAIVLCGKNIVLDKYLHAISYCEK